MYLFPHLRWKKPGSISDRLKRTCTEARSNRGQLSIKRRSTRHKYMVGASFIGMVRGIKIYGTYSNMAKKGGSAEAKPKT